MLAAGLRVLGPDHLRALSTRHEMARVLAARGRYEQTEQEFRDELAARLRLFGPDYPGTLITRDSLAALESRVRPPSGKPAD